MATKTINRRRSQKRICCTHFFVVVLCGFPSSCCAGAAATGSPSRVDPAGQRLRQRHRRPSEADDGVADPIAAAGERRRRRGGDGADLPAVRRHPRYAVKMFENRGRGIGQRGKDNGAADPPGRQGSPGVDRSRLRPGQFVTDGFAGETSRQYMAPDFAQGVTDPGCSPAHAHRRAHRRRDATSRCKAFRAGATARRQCRSSAAVADLRALRALHRAHRYRGGRGGRRSAAGAGRLERLEQRRRAVRRRSAADSAAVVASAAGLAAASAGLAADAAAAVAAAPGGRPDGLHERIAE